MKHSLKKALAFFLALMLVLSAIGCKNLSDDIRNKTDDITVSDTNTENTTEKQTSDENDGIITLDDTRVFFGHDIELAIDAPTDASVYYTVDGENPTNEAKAKLMNGTIKLPCIGTPTCYAMSIVIKYADGTYSDIMYKTVITMKNYEESFDVPVFSIITDPENLYGYETGIFVKGKVYDRYLKKNPGITVDNGTPANWNQRGIKWERECNLELLIPQTNAAELSQAVGIRTNGGWSRAHDSKPIKIYAREEYGEKYLKYEFFEDALSKSGTPIDRYKRLVLRHSGNDDGVAYIRDELTQRIIGEWGNENDFDGYECVSVALLYVNGKLQGCYWMHTTYCDEYFSQKYGKHKGEFAYAKNNEYYYPKSESTDFENQAEKDYNSAYNFGKTCDINNDKNYAKLCSLIDLDSYLKMWAINVYLCNYDWPFNNLVLYRYYKDETEEYTDDGAFDGRWHYCIHDTDFGLGLMTEANYRFFKNDFLLCQGDAMFKNLMKRQELYDKYVALVNSLIDTAYSAENVQKHLDQMVSESENAFKLFCNYNDVGTKIKYGSIEEAREKIVPWVESRNEYVKNHLEKNLNSYIKR